MNIRFPKPFFLTTSLVFLLLSSCSDSSTNGSKDKSKSSNKAGEPTAQLCKSMQYRPVAEHKTCRYSFKVPDDCSEAEGAFATLRKCRENSDMSFQEETFTAAAGHTASAVDSIHLTRILDCFDNPLNEWRFELGTKELTARFEISGELIPGETVSSASADLTISRVVSTEQDVKSQAFGSGQVRIDSLQDGNISLYLKADLAKEGIFEGTASGSYYLIPDSLCPAD